MTDWGVGTVVVWRVELAWWLAEMRPVLWWVTVELLVTQMVFCQLQPSDSEQSRVSQ